MSEALQVLQIRFHLATGIAFPANRPLKPIQGDGLFGYAWAQKQGLRKTPAEILPENIVFPELPFELVSNSYYAISAAFTPKEAFMIPEMVVRRPDWADVMAKHKVGQFAYQTSVGAFQGQQELYWLLVTPYVDFYCRGYASGISELLKEIWSMRHLGAKRAAGYGFITKIEVLPHDSDWSEWKDGQPTRNIPVRLAPDKTGLAMEEAPCRPPYWHKAFVEPCYVPPLEQFMPGAQASDLATMAEPYLQTQLKRFVEWKAKREEDAPTKKAPKSRAKKRH